LFPVCHVIFPDIAAIVFSYPQSPSAGIGNKTGKSTPAADY
jgi:hypothetical protein